MTTERRRAIVTLAIIATALLLTLADDASAQSRARRQRARTLPPQRNSAPAWYAPGYAYATPPTWGYGGYGYGYATTWNYPGYPEAYWPGWVNTRPPVAIPQAGFRPTPYAPMWNGDAFGVNRGHSVQAGTWYPGWGIVSPAVVPKPSR